MEYAFDWIILIEIKTSYRRRIQSLFTQADRMSPSITLIFVLHPISHIRRGQLVEIKYFEFQPPKTQKRIEIESSLVV